MNKKKVILFAAVIFMALTGFAQAPIEYYGHGSMIFNDGTEKKGVIKYSPQSPNAVLIQEHGDKFRRYKNKEVASFKLEGKHFISKINKGAVAANNNYFMQLIVPEDYKIKVFRYTEQSNIGTGNSWPVEITYYVQFDGEEEVFSVNSMKFTPFHKKGVQFVENCPALKDRISSKANGYKIGMISNDEMKAAVFQRVAEDYQNCN